MIYTINVSTNRAGEELISAYLYGLGALGVNIADPDDLKDLLSGALHTYWDYVDDALFVNSNEVLVSGVFDTRPDQTLIDRLEAQIAFAKEQMPCDLGECRVRVAEQEEENWLDNWKQFYHPIQVGDITVLPAWEPVPQSGTVVRINPAGAFGSGEHQTTRLCLTLLSKLELKGKQVADVGCGSGILGIAALKLGAKHCYFSDVDEGCIGNMCDNARLNGVTSYEVRCASLTDGCPVVADVMLANITADILIMLSKQCAPYIKDDGTLIISGIIADRNEEVVKAFENAGFKVVESLALDDWRAHRLVKK